MTNQRFALHLILLTSIILLMARNSISSPNQLNKPFPNSQKHALSDSGSVRNPLVQNSNQIVSTYLSDTWSVGTAPFRINQSQLIRLSGILAVGGVLYAADQSIQDAFHRSREHTIYRGIMDTGEFVEPMGQIEKMNPYCAAGFFAGYVLRWDGLSEASIQIIESLSIASGFKYLIRESVGRARPSEHLGSELFSNSPKANRSRPGTRQMRFKWPLFCRITSIACHSPSAVTGWPAPSDSGGSEKICTGPRTCFWGAAYGTAVSSLLLKLHEKRKFTATPTFHHQSKSFGFRLSLAL